MISRQKITLSFLFSVVLIFYLSIIVFAVNIPYWVDYDSILGFINNFIHSNFIAKVSLIFSQHNEHRIAFERIIALLTYYITGKVNFKLLSLIGSLSLIGLLAIFYRTFSFSKNKFLYFLPVALLLFQPQYWGAVYFATPSLSSLPCLFIAFLSLYSLTKQPKAYFFFSCLLAILATFTNGNGMLVFLVGLFPLLFKKLYRRLMLWVLIGAGCILIYFTGYINPFNHPNPVKSIFVTPLQTIIYFFSYLSLVVSDFNLKNDKIALFFNMCFGIAVFWYFIYLFRIKYYKKNIVLISFLLFIFFTVVVTALFRAGFGLIFPSRYKIFSVLFIIILYLSIADIVAEKESVRIFTILLLLSTCFNLFSYYKNYNYIILQNRLLKEGLLSWKAKNLGLSYPDAGRANAIMSNATAKKYYSFPQYLIGN